MGLDYDSKPPPPEDQHVRLVTLRLITSRGIPCILWAEDALAFVHNVPTFLFDQQVIVPDDLLESASSALQDGPYSAVPFTRQYADFMDESEAESSFPRGILHLLDRSDDATDELVFHPQYVLLLPQSYFGLDVRSKERFQSLVPPPRRCGVCRGFGHRRNNPICPKFQASLSGTDGEDKENRDSTPASMYDNFWDNMLFPTPYKRVLRPAPGPSSAPPPSPHSESPGSLPVP